MERYIELKNILNRSPQQVHSVFRSIRKQPGRFRDARLEALLIFSMESCRWSSLDKELIDKVKLFMYVELILEHNTITLHDIDKRCDYYKVKEKKNEERPIIGEEEEARSIVISYVYFNI